MNIPGKQTVHLFVFEGMADWEAAYAVAAINNPQFQPERVRYRVVTAAATLAPVTTMGGVRIVPDVAVDAITPAAMHRRWRWPRGLLRRACRWRRSARLHWRWRGPGFWTT
jgi:hypothetical protein